MENPYQDAQIALKYLKFLHSRNGQIQQDVLLTAIAGHLPKKSEAKILDAGCGPGWLCGALAKQYSHVNGCDASQFLLNFARTHFKSADFQLAGLDNPLPYPQNYFDCAILNMVGPDLANLEEAFKNLSRVLINDGRLIVTLPNPEYAYPAAEWKRSWLDVLLCKKPRLQKKSAPVSGTEIYREFGKGKKIRSYHYTLTSYLTAAQLAGFQLNGQKTLKPLRTSKKFDLNYQLSHWPLLLLLEFIKLQQ